MIDYGLLVSLIIAFGVPSLVVYRWPMTSFDGPIGFLDVALGPSFAGLAVGRLTTLGLDDPTSIGSLSDMMIIRSGVEFWPGVAAGVAVLIWSAHRAELPPLTRAADIAPLAMIAYAGYEAACFFRDGCFGPDSTLGLRPHGLSATMLPIGWFMAAAVTLASVGVHTLAIRSRSTPLIITLAAVLAVASVRAAGSIWLPHIGDGLTRQHLTSIVVATAAGVAVLATVAIGTPVGRDPTPRRV